jgi:excisionase family DNA binding protein
VDKLLFTPREVAQLLGISRSSLYELLRRGEIASVRIGRSRRVPRAALSAFVDQLHMAESGGLVTDHP